MRAGEGRELVRGSSKDERRGKGRGEETSDGMREQWMRWL